MESKQPATEAAVTSDKDENTDIKDDNEITENIESVTDDNKGTTLQVIEEKGTEENSTANEDKSNTEEEPYGLIMPSGDINWDCPCLQGMADGPCGEQFKAAFSCFHYSESEPKGSDCIDKFREMQECFESHPEHYSASEDDDDDNEKEKAENLSNLENETLESTESVNNDKHESTLTKDVDRSSENNPSKNNETTNTESSKKVETSEKTI